MLSHEDRVAQVKQRIATRERKKKIRNGRITVFAVSAACLALIASISFAMPGIAERINTGDYSGFDMAAGIFHDSAALGYIAVGLLAFFSGVCVTVLCFKLHEMNRENVQDTEREGRHGAD